MEIVLSEITQLERRQAADERGKIGEAFRTEVAGQLDVALSDSAKLRRDKEATSNAAHLTLPRASHVATPAQQSSDAMPDAGRTEVGLTPSIILVDPEIDSNEHIFARPAVLPASALEQRRKHPIQVTST